MYDISQLLSVLIFEDYTTHSGHVIEGVGVEYNIEPGGFEIWLSENHPELCPILFFESLIDAACNQSINYEIRERFLECIEMFCFWYNLCDLLRLKADFPLPIFSDGVDYMLTDYPWGFWYGLLGNEDNYAYALLALHEYSDELDLVDKFVIYDDLTCKVVDAQCRDEENGYYYDFILELDPTEIEQGDLYHMGFGGWCQKGQQGFPGGDVDYSKRTPNVAIVSWDLLDPYRYDNFREEGSWGFREVWEE